VLTSQNFGSLVFGVAFHPTKNFLASCSHDKSIKLWEPATGISPGECLWTTSTLSGESDNAIGPEGKHTWRVKDQKVNGYVVSVTGKTLYIFNDDAEDGGAGAAASSANEDGAAGSADGAGKVKTAPVAFFQCSAEIQAFDVNKTFDVACANIVVGCADGQVLQLWAAVLQTRG